MKTKLLKLLALSTLATTLTACSTSGRFIVPDGSKLYFDNRPEAAVIYEDGWTYPRAFGWDAMGIIPEGGIPYRLEKGGKVIQEGRLRPQFRVKSIFLPPIVGPIAFPTGLNPNITYDLINGKQE